jgi:hypothetical protein
VPRVALSDVYLHVLKHRLDKIREALIIHVVAVKTTEAARSDERRIHAQTLVGRFEDALE